MLVRKFEAKNVQEAIQMVKSELGPDAIILSAKDHPGRFGIAGEKSVELTAAISETKLREKKIAESKMTEEHKQKFMNSPARNQKKFINSVLDSYRTDEASHSFTERKYIDIVEEGEEAANNLPIVSPPVVPERVTPPPAAELAWQAVEPVVPQQGSAQSAEELNHLRDEVFELRKALQSFQKVPQSLLQMHPGAQEGVSKALAPMFEKLTKVGISKVNAAKILVKAQDTLSDDQLEKKAFVDAWVAKYLLDNVEIASHRVSSRYHMFCGPSGQGKTSALVKLATYLVLKEKKKIAILTTDNKKVGAADQLKTYAQILNVPFAIIRKPKDWNAVEKKLGHLDAILVDYPGLSLKTISETDWLRAMMPPTNGGRSLHYVQSLIVKDEDMTDIASRYQSLGVNDVIFTKLDETSQHGLIYNFQQRFNWPIHSFSIGSQIPEDFEAATKERFLDLIFKLTSLRKIRETENARD